ncbi:MAG: Sec-independent protein translocase protein TatB [Nitrospirae bacterium]|nr:Sec-independent protein translocase protein TatB [Nitrospirota bacterium]
MFDIGMQELILIFIVALLVFGPKRLPELGRTIGKGMAELKRAMYGIKEQMNSELNDIKDPMSHLNVTGKIEKEAATAKDSKEKGAE